MNAMEWHTGREDRHKSDGGAPDTNELNHPIRLRGALPDGQSAARQFGNAVRGQGWFATVSGLVAAVLSGRPLALNRVVTPHR